MNRGKTLEPGGEDLRQSAALRGLHRIEHVDQRLRENAERMAKYQFAEHRVRIVLLGRSSYVDEPVPQKHHSSE